MNFRRVFDCHFFSLLCGKEERLGMGTGAKGDIIPSLSYSHLECFETDCAKVLFILCTTSSKFFSLKK